MNLFQKMMNSQKRNISKYSRYLCDIRVLTSKLLLELDVNESANDNNASIKQRRDILFETYCNAAILLEQFIVLLKSCPEKGMSLQNEPAFDSVLSDSPIVNCYRNTEEWKHLYDKTKKILAVVNKQKTSLLKLNDLLPRVLGKNKVQITTISQNERDVTIEANDQLQFIKNEINCLINEYQFKLKSNNEDGFVQQHPIFRSIVILSQYIEKATYKLDELIKVTFEPMNEDDKDPMSDFVEQSEDLIATMLLIIQSLYKKHSNNSKYDENVLNAIDEIIDEDHVKECEHEDSKEILEENHLKEMLQENLSSDVKMLQFDVLLEKIRKVIEVYTEKIGRTTAAKDIVVRVIPILEQLVLFVQYFITQQVAVHRVTCKMLSVLLKIFTDFSTKG